VGWGVEGQQTAPFIPADILGWTGKEGLGGMAGWAPFSGFLSLACSGLPHQALGVDSDPSALPPHTLVGWGFSHECLLFH
jgi:hypothetical protein